MEYYIDGKGDKAIIFLHGWGGGYESFRHAADSLKTRFTVVNVSFFIHEEAEPLMLGDYADFVAQIIVRLRTENKCSYITAVCHSFGGRVGIRLAADNLIDRLMLVDSAGLKPRRGAKYCARRILGIANKAFRLNMNIGSEDYKKLSGIRKKTFVNIINTYQDSEAAEITVPTLLYWGERDKDTPMYMAKRFRRKIKDSALIIVKGGGHYSYLEDYPRFIAAINSFASF